MGTDFRYNYFVYLLGDTGQDYLVQYISNLAPPSAGMILDLGAMRISEESHLYKILAVEFVPSASNETEPFEVEFAVVRLTVESVQS
jgi:hypothetical protein